jgi:hypothetical protein
MDLGIAGNDSRLLGGRVFLRQETAPRARHSDWSDQICLGIPVYWLSYLFQWKAQRFQRRGGGVVGGTPTYAFLFPFGQLIFWTLVALVVGGGIGCGIIAIKRRAGLKRRGRAEAVSSRDSR